MRERERERDTHKDPQKIITRPLLAERKERKKKEKNGK